MAEESIIVIIHPDGRVELQVSGIKGDGCLAVTKAVEQALGNKVERDYTSEMYEQDEETELRGENKRDGAQGIALMVEKETGTQET